MEFLKPQNQKFYKNLSKQSQTNYKNPPQPLHKVKLYINKYENNIFFLPLKIRILHKQCPMLFHEGHQALNIAKMKFLWM